MRKCPNCFTMLSDQARFCHECGLKVADDDKKVTCPDCGEENPATAKFCRNCGKDVSEKRKAEELFEERPTQATENEIHAAFREHLQQKAAEEQGEKIAPAYLERLEQSDFKFSYEIKVKQLAEDLLKNQEKPDYDAAAAHLSLHNTFENLSDFFMIFYCSDLNRIELSEKILRWQNIDRNNIDLLQLVEDYLDFGTEPGVTYYTNFVEMPLDRLRTAGKSFLFPAAEEKILLICDQSVLGSLKEGFAFTERGFYWRMHFEPARMVLYQNLEEINREKDWIKINGQFFNANKSLNIKILKLLKKIKRL